MPFLSTIGELVGARHGVTLAEIVSGSRDACVVEARHVAMWLARHSSYTFTEIGRFFGGRHHTSVVHAFYKVEREVRTSPRRAAGVAALVRALRMTPTAIWPCRVRP